MNCESCHADLQLENMTKDQLMSEVIEQADLPEMESTASYGFKKQHLVELVEYLRSENGNESEKNE